MDSLGTSHERLIVAHSTLRGLLAEMNDAYNVERIDGLAERLADYPAEAPELRNAIALFEANFKKLVRLWN